MVSKKSRKAKRSKKAQQDEVALREAEDPLEHTDHKGKLTKKGQRKRVPNFDELINRPWCFYCERTFDDLMVLTSHQKAKHFKCDNCGRRLNTAGGLVVHLNQVHKESLQSVANAIPGREDPTVEIFGMEGIPEDIKRDHTNEVIRTWEEAVNAHTKATGNGPPGTKPKPQKRIREEPEALLRRFAAFVRQKHETQGINANGTAPNGFAMDPLTRPSVPGAGDVDDLIASVQNDNELVSVPQPMSGVVSEAAHEPLKKKTLAKDGKATRMAFSDDHTESPDELVAKSAKYSFDRAAADRNNVVLGDASGGYAGVVGGTNEAVDREMDG